MTSGLARKRRQRPSSALDLIFSESGPFENLSHGAFPGGDGCTDNARGELVAHFAYRILVLR